MMKKFMLISTIATCSIAFAGEKCSINEKIQTLCNQADRATEVLDQCQDYESCQASCNIIKTELAKINNQEIQVKHCNFEKEKIGIIKATYQLLSENIKFGKKKYCEPSE